jgi:hypothetical protein
MPTIFRSEVIMKKESIAIFSYSVATAADLQRPLSRRCLQCAVVSAVLSGFGT